MDEIEPLTHEHYWEMLKGINALRQWQGGTWLHPTHKQQLADPRRETKSVEDECQRIRREATERRTRRAKPVSRTVQNRKRDR